MSYVWNMYVTGALSLINNDIASSLKALWAAFPKQPVFLLGIKENNIKEVER